jgi:glycerol dehydrogenase-like iron-containing ADH family enzyme
MIKLGYIDKILYFLRKRSSAVHCEIFSAVEPDPSVETVMEGAKLMEQFEPDVIIAFGGGSVIDAAKGMWLFYEYPQTDFKGLHLRFLDIRKRTMKFPKMGKKAKMVAIPTTSGTGSEVTSFAVISDKKNNIQDQATTAMEKCVAADVDFEEAKQQTSAQTGIKRVAAWSAELTKGNKAKSTKAKVAKKEKQLTKAGDAYQKALDMETALRGAFKTASQEEIDTLTNKTLGNLIRINK